MTTRVLRKVFTIPGFPYTFATQLHAKEYRLFLIHTHQKPIPPVKAAFTSVSTILPSAIPSQFPELYRGHVRTKKTSKKGPLVQIAPVFTSRRMSVSVRAFMDPVEEEKYGREALFEKLTRYYFAIPPDTNMRVNLMTKKGNSARIYGDVFEDTSVSFTTHKPFTFTPLFYAKPLAGSQDTFIVSSSHNPVWWEVMRRKLPLAIRRRFMGSPISPVSDDTLRKLGFSQMAEMLEMEYDPKTRLVSTYRSRTDALTGVWLPQENQIEPVYVEKFNARKIRLLRAERQKIFPDFPQGLIRDAWIDAPHSVTFIWELGWSIPYTPVFPMSENGYKPANRFQPYAFIVGPDFVKA